MLRDDDGHRVAAAAAAVAKRATPFSMRLILH